MATIQDNFHYTIQIDTYKFDAGSTTVNIGTPSCTVTMTKIEHINELYNPGQITVTLKVSGSTLPTYSEFCTFFQSKTASLLRDTDSLATQYFVYDVRPTYRQSNNGVCYVQLGIYSLDKLLTLQRYSKAYTGKRLYKDILQTVIADKNFKLGGTTSIVTAEGLQFLKYKKGGDDVVPDTVSSSKLDPSNTYEEYTQPYLVQYDEPFYDFLIRTANRCGELVYFKGGKLNMGLTIPATPAKVEKYVTLEHTGMVHANFTSRPAWRNYHDKDQAKSSEIPTFTLPTANPDYLELHEKEEYDSFLSECGVDWKMIPRFFVALASASSPYAGIGGFLWSDIIYAASYTAPTNMRNVNKAYQENYNPDEKEKIIPFNTYHPSVVENKDKVYSEVSSTLLSLMTLAEEETDNGRIVLNLGSNYKNIDVADIIAIGSDKTEYIVTKVTRGAEVCGGEAEQTYTIEAIPVTAITLTKDESNDKHSTCYCNGKKFDVHLAVPYDKDKTTVDLSVYIPPSLPAEKRVRLAQPQIAYVTDGDDPKYLGRARVRYPWQGKNDEASPFIRQTEPKASADGGGVYFQPHEGDEVMIDYVNGNVEQPYIIGALYNADHQPSLGKKSSQRTNFIRGNSGQRIVFTEEKNGKKFVDSLLGPLNAVGMFMPDVVYNLTSPHLAGGIELTDEYGFYSIKMSSDSRSVSIASPIGNVGISAYTGISISAPQGDIKIEGKNVTITANNNLKIEGGVNAKTTPSGRLFHDVGFWAFFFEAITEGSAGAVEDVVVSYIDISFLRTILESFLAPKEGTVEIMSNRYLLLEAGLGKAYLPNKVLANDKTAEDLAASEDKWSKYYGHRGDKNVKIFYSLKRLNYTYTSVVDNLAKAVNEVIRCKNDYDTMQKELNNRILRKKYKPIKDVLTLCTNKKKDTELTLEDIVSERADLVDLLELQVLSKANTVLKAVQSYTEAREAMESSPKIDAALSFFRKFRTTVFQNSIKKSLNKVFDQLNLDANLQADPAQWNVAHIQIYIENLYQKIRPLDYYFIHDLYDTLTQKALEHESEYFDLNFAGTISDKMWKDWIHGLKPYKPNDTTVADWIGALIDPIFEKVHKALAFFDTVAYEQLSWGYDRASEGRILFSDNKDKTSYLDKNGEWQSTMNPGIGSLMHYLENVPTKGIKIIN